jgi:multisubunit Na+/H+ antiporter MnhB subunit
MNEKTSLHGEKSAAPPEPSDVRFGMRGLLFAMTCVAIATAVLGSSARKLNPETRLVVLWLWGICALIVLSRVIYCAWLRIQLERMAGRTLCVLSPRGWLGWARRPWMSVLIGLFWIGGGVYYLMVVTLMAGENPQPRGLLAPSLIPSVASGFLISIGIATVWWNRTVQLRENGVLRGVRLLRWTHVTKCHWDDESLLLEGVDQRHRDMQFGAVADAKTLDAAKRLVEHKTSNGGRSGLQNMLHDWNNKTSPLVPIQSGQTVTLHGMMSAFAAYVLVCVLAFSMFRPFGAPSGDFLQGVMIGIVIVVINVSYGARRVAEAGGPIVRLKRRFDWPSVLVAVGIAAGAYYVNQKLIFPHSYIGTFLGIISGIAASVLGGMIAREKYDLCANGVVLIRWTFLPWKSVRLLKWNRDGNGKLLLRSGWRRLAAKAPKEHRDIVDRVLREKIGFGEPAQQVAATRSEPNG